MNIVHSAAFFFFLFPLKTLPVVAIYKAGTGAFIQHRAVGWAAGEDANRVAKFPETHFWADSVLSVLQILCAASMGICPNKRKQSPTLVLFLWFFTSFLCACSVLCPPGLCPYHNRVSFYEKCDTAKTQRCRGGSFCLIHLLSLFGGRADRMCCLKGCC